MSEENKQDQYQLAGKALLINVMNDGKVYFEKFLNKEINHEEALFRISKHLYRIITVKELFNSVGDNSLDELAFQAESNIQKLLNNI